MNTTYALETIARQRLNETADIARTAESALVATTGRQLTPTR